MKAQNRKEIFLKALANGEEPKIKPLTREEELLAKQAKRESESTGGASDCDWNLMKNKPFGEETTYTEVYGKMTLTDGVELSNERYSYSLETTDGVYETSIGDELLIILDSKEYKAIVRNIGGNLGVGNGSLGGYSNIENNEDVFLIIFDAQYGCGLWTQGNYAGCSFEVKNIHTTIKTLDEKYLPEDYIRQLIAEVTGATS